MGLNIWNFKSLCPSLAAMSFARRVILTHRYMYIHTHTLHRDSICVNLFHSFQRFIAVWISEISNLSVSVYDSYEFRTKGYTPTGIKALSEFFDVGLGKVNSNFQAPIIRIECMLYHTHTTWIKFECSNMGDQGIIWVFRCGIRKGNSHTYHYMYI